MVPLRGLFRFCRLSLLRLVGRAVGTGRVVSFSPLSRFVCLWGDAPFFLARFLVPSRRSSRVVRFSGGGRPRLVRRLVRGVPCGGPFVPSAVRLSARSSSRGAFWVSCRLVRASRVFRLVGRLVRLSVSCGRRLPIALVFVFVSSSSRLVSSSLSSRWVWPSPVPSWASGIVQVMGLSLVLPSPASFSQALCFPVLRVAWLVSGRMSCDVVAAVIIAPCVLVLLALFHPLPVVSLLALFIPSGSSRRVVGACRSTIVS